jgi:hypothetical protein
MTAHTRAPAALPPAIAVAALLAVAAVVLALRAPAASADIGDENGGTNDGGSYSAWAWYAAAGAPERVSQPQPCTLPNTTEHPDLSQLPAFHEWEVLTSPGTNTFTVYELCTAVMFHDRHANQINGFNDFDLNEILGQTTITPAPIEDLVAQALTHLDPQPPAIETDLGDGVHGLVHVSVTFQLAAGDLGPQSGVAASAGPIRVELTAWPNGDMPITWNAGDALTPCAGGEPWGACTHDYGRSSFGQNHEGLGQDEYRVTAGITYTGRYDVFVDGNPAPIAGDEIGNVDRTVQLGLAVDEAQAVNTRG